MIAETNEQCRQIIAERETKDREEWKKREEELVERQREMEMARIAYEDLQHEAHDFSALVLLKRSLVG